MWAYVCRSVLAAAVFATAASALEQGRATAQSATSPVPADAASVARGRDIYAESCAMCHGVQGRGDGPLARTMVPRPADFRIHMAEGHTPEQLFEWTTNGVPDTAMQGFANELSVEDRWHVISYLQTFAPASE